jgi:hypothetical protein
MRRLGVALGCVLMLSALGAGSALATIKLELSRDSFKLQPREEFRSFISEGGGGYSPHGGVMTIETNPGTVSCSGDVPFSGLFGEVETNSRVVDKIKMTGAFGTLNAEAAESSSGVCSNNTSLGTSALVHLRPREGFLLLNGEKGTAKLREPSSTLPLQLEIAYSGGTTCTYTAASFNGTLTLEPPPYKVYEAEGRKDLNIQFQKQKVKPASGSPAACSKVVTVTAPFGVQAHKTGGGGYEYLFGRLI